VPPKVEAFAPLPFLVMKVNEPGNFQTLHGVYLLPDAGLQVKQQMQKDNEANGLLC